MPLLDRGSSVIGFPARRDAASRGMGDVLWAGPGGCFAARRLKRITS